MRIALLLFAGLVPAADAAILHKCVDAGGQASYQSQPCGAAQRTEWVREAPPEPARAPVTVSVPTPVRVTPAVRVRGTGGPSPPSACERARRAAQARFDREWNRLSFRQRSELDATVARACSRP